jgi:hypothetical protein
MPTDASVADRGAGSGDGRGSFGARVKIASWQGYKGLF